MKLARPSFQILDCPNPHLYLDEIESIGRTCYKSEDKRTQDSAKRFVENRMKDGHDVLLEFHDITVRFVCDRSIANELVRHRMASFAQESTRYVNYGRREMEFIPPLFDERCHLTAWKSCCEYAESGYLESLEYGLTPQIARSVLPLCLKTELVMKANIREWRHILKLRCDKAAHPQMRELMTSLLVHLQELYPVLFSDIMSGFDVKAAFETRNRMDEWNK